MFELKFVTIRDRKTGKSRKRYYAEVHLSQGRKIPLILCERPIDFLQKLPR